MTTSAEAPPRAGIPARRVHGARWLVGGALGAAVLAALEWLVLVIAARDVFASPGQMAALLPLAAGNLLPHALIASALLLAGDIGGRALEARVRWPRVAVGAAAALLALPYAIWLGDDVFSGPRASAIPLRPLWVAACAAIITLSLGAAAWLAAARTTWRRGSVPIALALVALTAALLWIGRTAYPNEYEALHAFVGGWSVLLATLAAREAAALTARLARGRRALLPALGAAAVAWSLGAAFILARREGHASLIWRETGASRWITARWTGLAPARRVAAGAPEMVLKPALETPRTAADRARRAAEPAPDIVIFNIDGLRRDHVGAYGYTDNPTTPNLDRIGARGVRFLEALSSYPATQAFNTALLLGRWVPLTTKGHQQPPAFRAQAITHLLGARDYHVFVKSWFELSSRNRFDPSPYAIDTYIPKSSDKDELEGPPEEWLSRLEAHIAEADAKDQPLFVWIHLLGTHPLPGGRFEPDPGFPFGSSRMDQYDSAIAGSDRLLGRVEQLLAAREDRRSTVWVLGSDHGTNTGNASRDLHDGVVRVPLIVVVPGVSPRTEAALVDASIDLAATVVDLAGIAPPASYDGVSLVPILHGHDAAAMSARTVPLAYRKLSGAVHRAWKTIQDRDALLLFDLTADPRERRNLADDRADVAHTMAAIADGELARRRDAARAPDR